MTISENQTGTNDVPKEGAQRPLNLRTLFDAGVHFGHPSKRWNPKMASFIFETRSKAHIIDLTQTITAIEKAKDFVQQVSSGGGQILMVGTKKQAQESVKEEAERVGAWYINKRWLGGMLTNFQTIQGRIERLVYLEDAFAKGTIETQTKRESLSLETEVNRLNKFFGGIKEMDRLPDAIFIVDTEKESIAINESRRLGIPIVAITDTNSDPADADYPIPGNDDSVRSVQLIVAYLADSIDAGKKAFKAQVEEQMAVEAELEAQEAAARTEAQRKAAQRANESKNNDKKVVSSKAEQSGPLKNKNETSGPPGKKSPHAAKDVKDDLGKVPASGTKVSGDRKKTDTERISKGSESESSSENSMDNNKQVEVSQPDQDQPDIDKGSELTVKNVKKKSSGTSSDKKTPVKKNLNPKKKT